MIQWINKKRNQKGFTLIELVVVIAILGILAAIAVPRLTGFRDSAAVNVDAQVAAQIVHNARIQELETGKKVLQSGAADDSTTEVNYDVIRFGAIPTNDQLQAGGTMALTGGGLNASVEVPYEVDWTPSKTKYNGTPQNVTEGKVFNITNPSAGGGGDD